MLREVAVLTGKTVKTVFQEALAQLVEPYVGQAVLMAADAPFEAGPAPDRAVRMTTRIPAAHDQVLRTWRLLFRLQASYVARKAIAQHYVTVCRDD